MIPGSQMCPFWYSLWNIIKGLRHTYSGHVHRLRSYVVADVHIVAWLAMEILCGDHKNWDWLLPFSDDGRDR